MISYTELESLVLKYGNDQKLGEVVRHIYWTKRKYGTSAKPLGYIRRAIICKDYVSLYLNDDKFGEIDTTGKSKSYSNDIVQNWKTGILDENNEHIKREVI
jgi:hypothetical protein|tara:strand:- start:153 stop:455 length:303 start_codon:yes stop_codon:yes gene_type:complete